jgi:hypothetical protein
MLVHLSVAYWWSTWTRCDAWRKALLICIGQRSTSPALTWVVGSRYRSDDSSLFLSAMPLYMLCIAEDSSDIRQHALLTASHRSPSMRALLQSLAQVSRDIPYMSDISICNDPLHLLWLMIHRIYDNSCAILSKSMRSLIPYLLTPMILYMI